MLGKLIKHEFRATARIMLPVLGALLALALLANLSIMGLTGDLSDIPMLRFLFILIVVFFGIATVAAGVIALVIMVSRFYRNLLKEEGYLMFTLPVSVHELVWSKLIVSLVWFLATGLLIFLVIVMTGLNLSNTNLEMILSELPSWAEIRQGLQEAGIWKQVSTLVFQGILVTLIGLLTACIHFYAAMSLGHMFTKNKILLSVVFFVGLSFAFNLLSMGYGAASFGIYDLAEWDLDTAQTGLRFLSLTAWHGIVLSAIQGIVYYFAATLSLTKRLNLE